MSEKDRAECKASTGFETWEEMQTYASWIVIQGITRGERLESTMASVFHLHRRWFDGLAKKEKSK